MKWNLKSDVMWCEQPIRERSAGCRSPISMLLICAEKVMSGAVRSPLVCYAKACIPFGNWGCVLKLRTDKIPEENLTRIDGRAGGRPPTWSPCRGIFSGWRKPELPLPYHGLMGATRPSARELTSWFITLPVGPLCGSSTWPVRSHFQWGRIAGRPPGLCGTSWGGRDKSGRPSSLCLTCVKSAYTLTASSLGSPCPVMALWALPGEKSLESFYCCFKNIYNNYELEFELWNGI